MIIESIDLQHDGVRFHCDQCPYKTTTKSILKFHKESQHEGIRRDKIQITKHASNIGPL